jgi:hypothetical protein
MEPGVLVKPGLGMISRPPGYRHSGNKSWDFTYISRYNPKKQTVMKRSLNINRLTTIILSAVLMATVVSCDKEPVNERPVLPPLESMVMDFSDFSQQPGGMKGTLATYENFFYAYFSVIFWNATSTMTMAVPVAAYIHALDQEPEYLGDHIWEWSYGFSYQSMTFEATLTAKRISNEEFSMEMVIASTEAPEQGIRWFDGVVRYDHTHALWNLYNESGTRLLEAEWNKNYETEAGDLTYTFVQPDQEESGSYIRYAYDPAGVYDASFTLSLSAGQTWIEWNTETLEGHIKSEAQFGDSEWHCWDSAANGLADKECE